MGYGLLKKAGAFLLASAVFLSSAAPGLAESLEHDASGTESAAEADQADTGDGAWTADETTPPAVSYIICLPEDAGAEYSYDETHRSEEGSDDAFTILLYEAGEQVSIGVESELGFALYGTDGDLFLKPDAGKLDFVMPDRDLQLVFDEPQTETQAHTEAPALPDKTGEAEPGTGELGGAENLQEPEAGDSQGTVGTGTEVAGTPSWEETPETEVLEPLASLKWEVSNVSAEVRMADGGSFPEGSALNVDTPDTVMEDEEGAMAYGKAVADALVALNPDAELWALYPFEVTLGEGMELPEGQKEFSVTFSDEEIVNTFQSGVKPTVATYAMDRETLTISDTEMVAAEDMDAYLTDDGKLAVEFLSEEGNFAIAFVKDYGAEADPEGETEAESEATETETEAPEVFGYENLRFTEDSYTLQKDADGTISSHTLIGLAADNLGTIPAASAEVSFRFVLPEGISAAEMQLTDGKAVNPDGETCIELWKEDESLPAAITSVAAGDGVIDVVVATGSADGLDNSFSGWELMLYGIAMKYDPQLGEADAADDKTPDATDREEMRIQVSAHAVLKAPQAASGLPQDELAFDALSVITIRDAKDADYGVMPGLNEPSIPHIPIQQHTMSIPVIGSGIFVGHVSLNYSDDFAECGPKFPSANNPKPVMPSSKDEDCWYMVPQSFWVYEEDGSVSKYDTKIYLWGDWKDSPINKVYNGKPVTFARNEYPTEEDTCTIFANFQYFGGIANGLNHYGGFIFDAETNYNTPGEQISESGKISETYDKANISLFAEFHFYDHETGEEVSVNGSLAVQFDGQTNNGLYGTQGRPGGTVGLYVQGLTGVCDQDDESERLRWGTVRGIDCIVKDWSAYKKPLITFKSTPDVPLKLICSTEDCTHGCQLFVDVAKQSPYTLTYHIDGASCETIQDGHTIMLLPGNNLKEAEDVLFPQLSVPGYQFDGWYSDPDYKNKYEPTTSVLADVDVYARFTEIQEGSVNITKTLDTKGWDANAVTEENKKFTFTLKGESVNQQKVITGEGKTSFADIVAGAYTVTEACNADVWETQMDGNVTVEGGETAEVACKNILKTGEVQVTKTLDTKGMDVGSIKDADKTFTFTLSGTSTAGIPVSKQVTIKGAGSAKFENIPVGTYTVTETCTGLWKSEDAKSVEVSDGQTAKVSFQNTVNSGGVSVTKTLDTKDWDVNGIQNEKKKFTFTLSGRSDAGTDVSQQREITGAGTASFTDIPAGTYTITEVCNTDVWSTQMEGSVTVTAGQAASVACKNTLKTGEVQVTKALDTKGLDAGSIKDADKTFTFTLAGTSTAGIAVNKQVTVKGAGTAKFEKVPVGTYTVMETCTGLWKAEAAKQATVTEGQTAKVTFTNTLNTGSVDVTKSLDLKGWDVTAVPDAAKKFTFKLSGTSTSGIAVSQQKAITGAGKASFTDIPAGTYTITEVCNTDVWSTQMDGNVTVTAGQAASVACKNTLKAGEVQVTKTLDTKGLDAGSIKDADKTFTFTLAGTSTAGIAVNKQVTVKGAGSAKVEKIPVGTYTVTETCTGLWKAEAAKQVTVTDGKSASVTFTNTLNTGSVDVTKSLDLKGWDVTAVPDAAKKFTFKLNGTSTSGIAVSQQKAITGAGKASFADIPAGTYTITETCNTDVWSTQMDGNVTVTAGQASSVTCKNTLKAGNVQVAKALDTKGADAASIPEKDKTFTFTLSGTSTAGIAVSKQAEVTGAGTASFEDVPAGTYTVTETCDTSLWNAEGAKQATVTDGQTADVSFTNTLKTGSVTVTKTLDTRGADAASIPEGNKKFTFTLSGTSNAGTTVSQQKVVAGAGKASFEDVPVGTYSVTEECDTGLWNAEGAKQATVTDGRIADVSFTNTLKTGSVTVTKTLNTKGVDIASIPEGNKKFTFTLSGTSDAGTTVSQQKEVTGAGKVSFADIPVGTYTVTEECKTEIWDTRMEGSVTVTSGKDAAVSCTNTLKTGSVQVAKALDTKGRDAGTIPEADKTFAFALSGTSAAGTAVNKTVTVVGAGTASFEDVPVGNYSISEACDTQLWFPEAAKDVRVSFGQTAQAGFKNTIRIGDVCISVMDSETLVELDGAEVTVTDEDGHLAGTVISSHDDSVFVKGLEIGKEYTVRVVKPRKGYSSGILTVEGYQSPCRDTGYTVDGGHYAYSELELSKIEGGQAAFTLTRGGIQTLNIFNKAVRANLRIQAQGEAPTVRIEDGRATDITWEMKGIPGAEYNVYAAGAIHHPDGHSKDVLADGALAGTVKTDETGYATLKGLTPGDYRIGQAKAPAGYLPGEDLEAGIMAGYEAQLWDKADYIPETFTYDAVSVNDRQVVDLGSDLEPENEDEEDPRDPDKGLYKKTGVYRCAVDGEDETPVEGARFTLYANKDIVDVYGNVAIPAGTEVEDAATDTDGRAAFTSDLPIGEYAARGADHREGYYSTVAEAIFDTARYASDDTVKYVRTRGEVRDYITVARLFLKDDLTGNELAGATLVVSDAEGTPFATIATEDTAGAGHVIKGLDPGREYVVGETVPREGYTNTVIIPGSMEDMLQKKDRTSVSFTLEDHTAPSAQDVPEDVTLEIDNAYVTGSFAISKDGEELISVETETGKKTLLEKVFDWAVSAFTYGAKEQEGAEFTVYAAEDILHPDGKTGLLYHKGDVVGTLVRTGAQPAVVSTDAHGKAAFRQLYLGRYTVRETGVPEGFTKNPAEAPVTLAYKDYETQEVGAAEGAVEYHNIRQKVLVSVTKRDRDDHEMTLEGAVFGICAQDDIAGMGGSTVITADTLVETAQTGADGVARFTAELPLGKYYVKEILPPKGYASSDERISIDAAYQPDGRDHLEFRFDFYDEATRADVYKLSEGAGEPVEGARLAVLDSGGETVDAWVTDGLAHRVTGLMPGHAYTLREAEPAPGYATAEDIEFIAADRGADGALEPQEIAMYDPSVKVRISAMERGKDGAESPLDGVELRVTDMEGNEAAINGRALHWVSQGEAAGCYEGLPAGRYTVSAVKVPAGYVMPEAVAIEVKDTTDLQQFTIPVETIMADIYATDKETGERVEGAAIDLLSKDGEAAYSDATLEWAQERVPAGKYAVHVKAVPDVFVTPEKDTKITVRETAETQYFELELGVTRLAIKAADKDTGEGVKGVELRLESEDGKAVAKWTSDGGWEKIDRIAPGRYAIAAASVPAGYKAPEKVWIDVKNTEDLQEFTLTLEKLPQEAVPKTGDSLNAGLLAVIAELACLLLALGIPLVLTRRKKRN